MSDIKYDMDFEKMLIESIPEMPPADISHTVTPWRKAMNMILWGMGLTTVTFNFLLLQYILPTIGILLMVIGFQMLRSENKWFKASFIVSILQLVTIIIVLISNTIAVVETDDFMVFLSFVNVAIDFAQYFCFWRALVALKAKSGLEIKTSSAGGLIIWYAIMCALAIVQYVGLIIAGILLIIYIIVIRNIYKLSKQVEKAGYCMAAAPVLIEGRKLTAIVIGVLALGFVCGYTFGSSYDMNWQLFKAGENKEVIQIKSDLVNKGVPAHILDDMTDQEILECKGFKNIIVESHNHFDGQLNITGVGIELAGQREQWKLVQHFKWADDEKFWGTESVQIWPAYRNFDGWWGDPAQVSGRVFYEDGDDTYVAPYHYLGQETFTYQTTMFGKRTSTDVFATFSMPNQVKNRRGYVTYNIKEMEDGMIVDSWMNYTHQVAPLQYPAMTAMEKRMVVSWNDALPFVTVQDALQFYRYNGKVETW